MGNSDIGATGATGAKFDHRIELSNVVGNDKEDTITKTSNQILNNAPSSSDGTPINQNRTISPKQTTPSPARDAIKELMSKSEIPKTIHDKNSGKVKTVYLPNLDPPFLASLKRNIDSYKQEMWERRGSLAWINHVVSRIFSFVNLAQSNTQNAIDYYDLAVSQLSPGQKKELEVWEKYGGPYVGKMNSDSLETEGEVLEFKEGFYYGPNKDNKPLDGAWGKMEFRDGAVYEGLFRNGRPDKENGVLTLPNGKSIFLGENDSSPEGFLEAVKLADGSFFRGSIVNAKPQGQGKLFNASTKQIHEGMFLQGKYYTQGKLLDDLTGDCYEGDLVDGIPEGRGKWVMKEGAIYEGSFKNGQINGRGQFSDPLTGESYIGTFVNGEPEGKGRWVNKDGMIYIGSFKKGYPHGEGKLIDPSTGENYMGNFVDGKPQGLGKKEYQEGSSSHGEFVEGLLEGTSKKVYQKELIVDIEDLQKKIKLQLEESSEQIKNEQEDYDKVINFIDKQEELLSLQFKLVGVVKDLKNDKDINIKEVKKTIAEVKNKLNR